MPPENGSKRAGKRWRCLGQGAQVIAVARQSEGPVAAPHWFGELDPGSLRGGERQLFEAVERALRHIAGKLAIVLHLSRLPVPREHHVRVAQVLLQDTAHRHDGHVFTMANHDLVLLCADAASGQAHPPASLPEVLASLFAADSPESASLTSLWRLETETWRLRDYLVSRTQPQAAAASPPALPGEPISLVALEEIVVNAPLTGLLAQQTGMMLLGDRARPLAARLAPAYQHITVDLRRLAIDGIVARALSDPFLFRHFAAVLDGRMLGLLQDDLRQRGRLLRSAVRQRLPVMIELGLRAVVSPDFATFARSANACGVTLWVGVSLLQAGSELDLLEHARGVLKLTGARLALTGIDPACLALIDPLALQPDLVLLPWSAGLRHGMRDFDRRPRNPRVFQPQTILVGADGEQAIAWGQARGIELYHGSFLDQVQAATRMNGCHSAADCTLGQCRSRASALALPGRAGCSNPALLEAGFAPWPPAGGERRGVAA